MGGREGQVPAETLAAVADTSPVPMISASLVDPESRVVRRRQTRGFPDRAIDIDRPAATAADNVMVVVPNAVFVQGRGAGRLDPPDEVIYWGTCPDCLKSAR